MLRRQVLQALFAAPVLARKLGGRVMSQNSTRMPVVFVGHGSPMNAIEDNAWSKGFQQLGAALPQPKAIVAVSAHWVTDGTQVTADEKPRTVHDLGGFPDELFRMEYPASGSPELARRVVKLVGDKAALSTQWGLDHGTWTVLHWLRPRADVPVIQVGMDANASLQEHYALGRALAPLREDGVLLLASGNVTHNLRHAFGAMRAGGAQTPGWARSFDARIADAAQGADRTALVRALEGDDARLAHPSIEHYVPLLYAAGATDAADRATFPIEGFDWGSLSMRSIVWGG